MLKAFNKLLSSDQSVILIVGVPGTGKHLLANAILDANPLLDLQIRTAVSLPLPTENDAARPRIDFVILVLDLTNRESFIGVKQSLRFVDVSYFMGKVCVVASRVNEGIHHSVSIDAVSELVLSRGIEMVVCNKLDSTEEVRHVALQLVRRICQSYSGLNGSVFSPLLVSATSHFTTNR